MQSGDVATPIALARRNDDNIGPILEFNKARGTFAAPNNVNIGDVIGVANFVARFNNVPLLSASIQAIATSIDVGPSLSTAIEFRAAFQSVLAQVWTMDFSAAGSGRLTGFGANPIIEPALNDAGQLGEPTNIWNALHVNFANAYNNVCLGGATPGAGANAVVVLPSATAASPGASVGLAHLYALPAFALGTALALFQAAPTQVYSGQTATNLVPVTVNGVAMYLFAWTPPS
jgi:hypothetical protein